MILYNYLYIYYMVKVSEGLKSKDISWIEFGKYMIHSDFLNKNVLLFKYLTYSPIPWLKRRKINDVYKQFWQDLIYTKTVNYGLLKKCDTHDIELFEQILTKSKVNLDYKKENVMLSVDDYVERFNILQGEISIGNDGPEIKKELKTVISKLGELGRMKESDKNELLNLLS